MSWLDRLFGQHQEGALAEHKPSETGAATVGAEPISPERVGLHGEFDQSGLAKRVAKAFDQAGLSDQKTVWIAQTGATVVLKGRCIDQAVLSRMVEVAKGVSGAGSVETEQVIIG